MEALILDFINYVLERNVFLVYVIFFISSVLQLVFPPFPSDVVLVFEGYITTISNSFGFVPVLLNAMTGTFVGSLIVYEFGLRKGSAVFNYKIIKRYIDEKHRKRTERIFEKYGSFAIIVSKFVPGVNAIMLLSSGIFKMKARIVYPSIFVSVLIHHILVLMLGRFLGNNLGYVKDILKTYNGVVIILIAIAVLCAGIYLLVKRKKVKG
ncbi:MAG: DedA family protein [Clostridia bacterium]|nr:DedA family protein [Clostridia bacterium]